MIYSYACFINKVQCYNTDHSKGVNQKIQQSRKPERERLM